jgi:diacylglycerol kinase
VKAIIFSVLTCGIYAIYWFVALTNEMNLLSGNEKDTASGTAFLLTLITCGIYGFYWAYRMGVKRDQLEGKKDGSSAILYLVLMIFGLGIVAYALMQDAINKAIEKA